MLERMISYLCIFVALLIVLPVHEFAHAFAAVKSGDDTPRLYGRYTLNPLAHFDPMGLALFVFAGFGWAKPVPINPSNFRKYKRGAFFTSIAGVLANYLIAFIVYPLIILSLRIPDLGYFDEIVFGILFSTYSLSLSFFVFNLLPIYPLDGFRVIDVFSKRKGRVYWFLRKYGRYILLGLLAFSIIADFSGIYWLDFLGIGISYATDVISVPITAFWGLIF